MDFLRLNVERFSCSCWWATLACPIVAMHRSRRSGTRYRSAAAAMPARSCVSTISLLSSPSDTPREEEQWPNRASRSRSGKVLRKTRACRRSARDARRPQAGPRSKRKPRKRARHLRRPATERREFRAADAAVVPAAFRRNPSRPRRGHPRRAPHTPIGNSTSRARQLASALARGRHSRPATRSRSCCPTCRRWSRRITACRCSAPCSTPSIPGSSRQRSPTSWSMARPRR